LEYRVGYQDPFENYSNRSIQQRGLLILYINGLHEHFEFGICVIVRDN
jgi:hypothetical protein